MIRNYKKLSEFLASYTLKNSNNNYKPVAVGKYGIRLREDIYSKELAKDFSNNKLIFQNTLTLGMGSNQIDIGIVSKDVTYSVSPAYHTYRIIDINSDYLRFCLMCRNADMFKRYVKRGSRQGKTIDRKRWLEYKIPVHSFADQLNIIERLQNVEKLITSKVSLLKSYDQLIKSRFIEMFGDVDAIDTKWINCLMGDVVEAIDPQPSHRTPPISSDGVPYIGIKECDHKTKKISFGSARKVGKNVLMEHLNRYSISKGDFIIGKIGTIGKPFFVPTKRDFVLSANTILIKPNHKLVAPVFLITLFRSEYISRQIETEKKSTSQPALGIKKVRDIKIVLPPKAVQNQFADFYKKVDKLKIEIQKSLDETHLLFDSLMQEYFG